VQLYNLTGHLIAGYSQKNVINNENLNTGVYFVQIINCIINLICRVDEYNAFLISRKPSWLQFHI